MVRNALEVSPPPFTVLFVHGPGGVGKTTLLERLAELAVDAGIATVRLDLGAIDPSPAALLRELASELKLQAGGDPLDALAADARRVLILDTYEAAAPFDGWVRDRLIPRLAVGAVVVIAGRKPPSREWFADPGWRELLRVVSLRNLGPNEARAYLLADGVPESVRERAIALTHGHPLALSLVSELVAQRGGRAPAALPHGLGDAPDIVRTLLESFLEGVPSERQRHALQICAHARYTTEGLLREVLAADDASELFAWLRGLSFVEETARGLAPHDLARDVLEADLRWRDPAAYQELHEAVYAQARRRATESEGIARQHALMDWNFLLRTNPFTASFIDWRTYGDVYYDVLRRDDLTPLLEIAALHEGHASRELVAHWLDRQPAAFRVLRSGSGQALGFGAVLALHEASESEIAADPGAASMWAYAQRHGAPRPGEEVFAARFYIDRNSYQATSASYSAIIAAWVEQLIRRQRPAWEFLGFWADPDRIEPFMSYIDFHRAEEADFEVGGRRYGVFAHDWRLVNIDEWLQLVARRESETGFDAPAVEETRPVVALSAPEFAAAVRDALRNLHRPEALATNPLLHSRLVRERGSATAARALREMIEDAAGSLLADPRDEKLHRVLARTYLRPARTQELAAEALDLPLSTYKRHLKRGVERVSEWLWNRELYGQGQ